MKILEMMKMRDSSRVLAIGKFWNIVKHVVKAKNHERL